jgi:MFS family permease
VAKERSTRVLIATVILGTVLNPLDGAMMAAALPAIRENFAASAAVTTWLITVYYLGGAVAQPIMGRIADQLGARRVFIGGLLIVVLACIGSQFVPSVEWLIALRLAQAFGSSVAFPAGLITIRRSLEHNPAASARAVGSITWINSLASVVGPLIGGLMVELVGWRGPFLFGIPFALVGAIVASLVLPADTVPSQTAGRARMWTRVDAWGALLLGTVIAAVQLAIVGVGGTATFVWLGVVAVTAVLLIVREKRAKHPFLDTGVLFADATTLAIFVQYMLANFSFFAVIITMPSWLQLGRGLSPLQSGSVTFPIAVVGVVATLTLSRFVYQGAGQWILLATAAVTLGGAAAFAGVDETTPLLVVALLAVAIASPNNLTTYTLQSSLYLRIPTHATGAATGLFQTFRYMGATLASTVVGLNLGATSVAGLASGMHVVMLSALVASSVAMVLAVVLQPGAAPGGHPRLAEGLT